MDVYLVPIGQARHELYCEVPDEPEPPPVDPAADPAVPATFAGRMKIRFIDPLTRRVHETIAEAEREWRERQAGRIDMPEGRWGRAKARMRAWIAEKVAEQRLLWHMRRQDACTLFHPDDVEGDAALRLMRESLQRDYERHRRWFVFNVLGFIGSVVTFLIPGPNLLAYYFFFRLAGHYLSMKGARHGMNVAVWTAKPCPELAELRTVVSLPPRERADRVRAIAHALRLEHLAIFFNRVAAV